MENEEATCLCTPLGFTQSLPTESEKEVYFALDWEPG